MIFRLALKKFIAREFTPHREEWDKARIVPKEAWKKMGKQGFLCAWLPEEYGGSGVDFKYSVIVGQELLRGDAMGIGVPNHQDVATHYVYRYGSEELKKKTPSEMRLGRRHRLYLYDRAGRRVGRRRRQDKGRKEG